MDAIKDSGGMPAKGSPKYVAEMENIIGLIRDPMRKAKPGYGIAGLLTRGALHLDELTTRLRERGFNFETPDDLITAVENRLRTGKKLYANAESGSANSGLEKDTAPTFSHVTQHGSIGASMSKEFDGREPIQITNAKVDKARAKRGAEPIMGPARRSDAVTWDMAMARLDDTPQAARILVDKINDGDTKTIDDVQQAMLLHEEISLRNERAMEAERAVDEHGTPEERSQARDNFDALEARLNATERASNAMGTSSARALRIRQLAAFDDYTLASLETRERNSTRNDNISVERHGELKALSDQVEALKKKLLESENDAGRAQAMDALSGLMREHMKEVKSAAKSGGGFLDVIHQQRDAAMARVKARRSNPVKLTTGGFNPEAIPALLDEVIIGASHIADGIVDIGKWSKKVIDDIGSHVKPYLKELYAKSKEYHDMVEKQTAVKRTAKEKPTAIEKIAAAAEAKDAGATEGGELTNKMVFDLAREHVRAGVEGLDNVISAVQKDLEPHFPGLTVREVRDMFTDYGKVKFPSKAEDLVALRDYRRQGQLLSALEDTQEGLSPKRTGMQRDNPSPEVLALQKQVQEAMRKSGISSGGDPTRLKSNLERYKTILTNRITEAQRRLRDNDYVKRPKSSKTVLDSAANNLQSELNNLTRKIDYGFEKERLKNRTPTEKVQDALVKWRRTALLLSPKIVPKLMESGLIKIFTNPISRLAAQPLRLIPGLVDKAPAQLRIDLAAEAHRVAGILSSGPEAIRKLIGKSKLDDLSKKRILDSEMMNFIGNAHGMIKEPVRQGEYRAAIDYYTKQAVKDGLDIRDPATQTSIVANAVADANHEIFQGDNMFSKHFVSIVINSLRQSDKTGAKTLANVTQFLMPIVRVSSNIAQHTARLGVGLPESFIRIAKAFHDGELANKAEGLSHEDAQSIVRSFSAGMTGLVLAGYAWTHPQYFGGIYGGPKPKDNDFRANQIRIGPFVLPGWMNHAPEMQWLNTIASARRVYDQYSEKGTGSGNALFEALAFSVMAPVKNMPFIETWLRLFSDHQSAGQTLGQTAQSVLIPGGRSIMDLFDDQQRSPKTAMDEIKMAIPGLRQTVPVRGDTARPVMTMPAARGSSGRHRAPKIR